jgi:hypothetical protein
MISRSELEELIEREVVDLYKAEKKLARDYKSLCHASVQKRRAFLLSMDNLKRRAGIVDVLLNALPPATSSSSEGLAA